MAPERLSEEGHPLFSLPIIGDVYLTNTLVAMVLVDIIVIIIALVVRRSAKRSIEVGEMIPRGFSGALEALMEFLFNLTEETAGKWAKVIFPFFLSITLMLLVANWMELIPGVDSIGFLHEAEHGYPKQELLPGVYAIVKGEVEHGEGASYGVVPFVRVLSTDLNFTAGLAIFAVVMIQVIGVRARGIDYFSKFINVKTFKKNVMFGAIDFAVGLLEIVSEFSKIMSFSFRLFGNIFAGSVMLFVIGSLVPVLVQSVFLGLEFFVGLVQAVVFGMLTMVFMTQATMGHGGHEEEESH